VKLTASTRATVAKQLTKIEYDLFRAVPSSEFMDICKSNVPRPSLSRLVEHTNKASTSLLPPPNDESLDLTGPRTHCLSRFALVPCYMYACMYR
jgi:hypothetical protein